MKELVAGIAAAVGLDEQALFGGEVQALGRRLQDVKESLTTLADVAEARAKIRIDTKNGIQDTKTYLDTVQKVSLKLFYRKNWFILKHILILFRP